jgi:hypothetical protein
MLFGEIFTIYCEKHIEHTDTLCGQNAEFVPFRKHIKSRIQTQPINAVWGNICSLLWEPYGTHKYTVWAEYRDCPSKETHHVSTKNPNRLMLFGETVAFNCENHTEQTDTLYEQNVEFVH